MVLVDCKDDRLTNPMAEYHDGECELQMLQRSASALGAVMEEHPGARRVI